MNNYTLGSLEASEKLINDLYLELRKKVNAWAAVTQQTPQARMGYIGQHLTSIVTGYPGGRSGARGYDLVIDASKDEYGEIKTCYRVDQLGKCNNCGTQVSSIEDKCWSCESENIKRNDDSKWLISIRTEEEFEMILDPKFYYLVLFEYVDIKASDNNDIKASIWQVNPKERGFAFCMIDYFLNIRAASKSKAPFNLWPYQLKFDIMKAELIYQSLIKSDDTVETLIFPGRDVPEQYHINKLVSYSRSSNLTLEKVKELGKTLGFKGTIPGKKLDVLKRLDQFVEDEGIDNATLADAIARVIYLPDIQPKKNQIPEKVRNMFEELS
jgi:hypothetical protein